MFGLLGLVQLVPLFVLLELGFEICTSLVQQLFEVVDLGCALGHDLGYLGLIFVRHVRLERFKLLILLPDEVLYVLDLKHQLTFRGTRLRQRLLVFRHLLPALTKLALHRSHIPLQTGDLLLLAHFHLLDRHCIILPHLLHPPFILHSIHIYLFELLLKQLNLCFQILDLIHVCFCLLILTLYIVLMLLLLVTQQLLQLGICFNERGLLIGLVLVVRSGVEVVHI